MPMFDSFDPDGGQSSFFAPLAGGEQGIGVPETPSLGQPQSTYPDIPGAAPAPNQTASGYYPDEPAPQGMSAPFPQDEGALGGEQTSQSLGQPPQQGATRGGIGDPNRGVNNLNPGNIGYGPWAASHGASGASGWDTGHQVAEFPSAQKGWQAQQDLAMSKYAGGRRTANQLIADPGGWTPGNYRAAANVARGMGISPTDDLGLNDPSRMRSFQQALTNQELGPEGASRYAQLLGNAGQPLAPGGIDLRKQRPGRPDFGQAGREFGKREQVLGPIRQDIEKDLATPRPSFQEWAQQNNMPSRPPNYEEWKQQHNHSILQGMGPAFVMAAGAMMILGAAFGGRSSGARLAGIEGMSGLVNGFSSGNRQAAAKGLSQMRESFSEMQRLYEDSRQAYNDAMTAKDKNIDQKYRILQLEASKFHDMAAYQAATEKRMEFFDRMNIQRENQALRISAFLDKKEKEIRDFEWGQQKAGWKAMQTEAQQARIANDNAMRGVGKADNDLRLALQAVPQNAEAVDRLRQNSTEAHARAAQAKQRYETAIAKLSGQTASPTEQTGSQAQAQPLGIPQEAIDELKKNPSPQNRKHFDAAFQQPGASDRILGPAEGETMPAAEPPTETYSSGGEF